MNKQFIASVMAGSIICLATIPATVSAAGLYAGVDAVQLVTNIGGIFGTNYSTAHLRIKAGYQLNSRIAFEAYFMTSGNDTSTETSTSGGTTTTSTDKYDTGTIIGANFKPIWELDSVNIYGLLGISQHDVKYHYESATFSTADYSDSVLTYGAGVGIELNKSSNIPLNIEAMYRTGTVNFNSTFFSNSNINEFSISVGANYYF